MAAQVTLARAVGVRRWLGTFDLTRWRHGAAVPVAWRGRERRRTGSVAASARQDRARDDAADSYRKVGSGPPGTAASSTSAYVTATPSLMMKQPPLMGQAVQPASS